MEPQTGEQKYSRGWGLAMLVAAAAAIGPFSVTTYMPSFPEIMLQMGATDLQMQQTLSAYLATFSLMMLFHGALSDAFGRRRVVLAALSLYVLASIGCFFADTIGELTLARAGQGLGAGSGMVVGRALLRDRYAGHHAQRMLAQVMMVFAVAPGVAPIIGGWLQAHWGWRSVFLFLSLTGISVLTVCLFALPETLARERRQPFHPGHLLMNYFSMLQNTRIVALVAAVALNFGGMYVFIIAAPVFVIKHLGLGVTEFGWLMVPLVSGMILGNFIAHRVAVIWSPAKTIVRAYGLMIFAALLNLAVQGLLPVHLPGSMLPMMIYSCGMSLAMPSLSLMVLNQAPEMRGTVSALQGFAQTANNALIAGVWVPLLSGQRFTLALGMLMMCGCGLTAWLGYWQLRGPTETA
ncbi:MAG: multidrug effflux MFS transporter [Gammaproteobacteria bacterium]|nr:multidrug effflux MFS transporter [Gammaproteobacteria bacterium]